ncbi:MAG: hypothetical protein ACOX3L_07625 [Lutisporaceae bacterium]
MACYEIWSLVGQWLSGIGILVVSFLAYRISKKQIELSKQELKIALYKQRYDIYIRLVNIMRKIILTNDSANDDSANKLGEIRDEVVFLFGKEIHDYLLLIINNYENLNSYYYGKQKDKNFFELEIWFINQFSDKKELRERFKSYLDLSNYGISKD